MKERISPSDIASEIRMSRSVHKGSFLVVEGDCDGRFFGKFTDNKTCEIIPAYSRDNVIGVLTLLSRVSEDKGVLGIIDADFSRIMGEEVFVGTILKTDAHDIEMMILVSPALVNVLAEYSDKKLLEAFLRSVNKSIIEVLIDSARPIGSLLLLSLRNSYYFSMRELPYDEFVDANDLAVDVTKLVNSICSRSVDSTVEVEMILKELAQIHSENLDDLDVCRGHDVSNVLLIGLKRVFGSWNSRTLEIGQLEGVLRLSYEYTFFKETSLFRAIDQWEGKTGYQVLRR